MVMIFSNEAIDGLHGTYANYKLFDGDFDGAKLVYTDVDAIAKQAIEKGIEVRSIKNTEDVRGGDKPKSSGKIKEEPSATIKDEGPVFDIVSETPAAMVTTTIEQDIEAGMSNEAILAKHDINKKKLTAIKRKLTIAKKKEQK